MTYPFDQAATHNRLLWDELVPGTVIQVTHPDTEYWLRDPFTITEVCWPDITAEDTNGACHGFDADDVRVRLVSCPVRKVAQYPTAGAEAIGLAEADAGWAAVMRKLFAYEMARAEVLDTFTAIEMNAQRVLKLDCEK